MKRSADHPTASVISVHNHPACAIEFWSVAETGDFNGDGQSAILWRDQSGRLGVWLMNGSTVISAIGLGNIGASWQVQAASAD